MTGVLMSSKKKKQQVADRRDERPIDPHQIFLQADSFWEANRYLLKSSNPIEAMNKAPLSPPAMVISAFASELYFKCLLCLRHGHPHKELNHNLERLFTHLDDDVQKHIEAAWVKYTADNSLQWDIIEKSSGVPVPRDLRSALAAGKGAFSEVRYIYEGKGGMFNLMELPPMIRSVIITQMPHWNVPRLIITDAEPFRVPQEVLEELGKDRRAE